MAKPRILWCSQTPSIHTGYGIITHDILERLHATGKYEIACHGWHERESPKPRYPLEAMSGPMFPYKLFHNGGAKDLDPVHEKMGKKNFHDVIEAFKPDIVIMFGDIYMFDYVFNHPDRKKFHLAIYYAIDGAPIPEAWGNSIKKADTAITFSKFACAATKERTQIDPLLIYHGIDYPMWSQPLPSELIASKKKELFKDVEDPFVFGMVARNQPRKNIPVFFESFAAHVSKNPNSRMLLHSVIKDQGWDLNLLVHEFKLDGKVFIPKNLTPQRGLSNQDLRTIYNCMDVHVNTAWGEGFGIPIVESMACGIPNIMPSYTTGPEFIDENKAGVTIRPAVYCAEALSHIRRAIVDPTALYKAMNFMVENKSAVKMYSRNAKTAAAKFDWNKIIPLWEQAIDKMLTTKSMNYVDFERI
jgi:D-inositol-3-phosphate glycosyltransferase